MPLEVKGMTRSFKFKKGTEGPVIREDTAEYEFKTTIGTKG